MWRLSEVHPWSYEIVSKSSRFSTFQRFGRVRLVCGRINHLLFSLTWHRLEEDTSTALTPGTRKTRFVCMVLKIALPPSVFILAWAMTTKFSESASVFRQHYVVYVEARNEIVSFRVRSCLIQISSLILGFRIIRNLVKQPWTHLYGYCWAPTIRPHWIIYLLNNSFCFPGFSSPILKDNGDIFIFPWI